MIGRVQIEQEIPRAGRFARLADCCGSTQQAVQTLQEPTIAFVLPREVL